MSVAYATTVLITGGTQGMGYYTALSVARQCPKSLVVVASRTDPQDSATSINKTTGQKNVIYIPLDLGTKAKVRDFVTKWEAAKYPPIRSLILNAAIQLPGNAEYNNDGVEKSFAINHIGHALLFHLLFPHLTPDARIVVVASGVHDLAQKWGLTPAYTTAEQVAHPSQEAEKNSNGRDRYATTKVANVLWTYALARRLEKEGKGKTVASLDPGLMPATGLVRNAAWPVRFLALYVAPKLLPLLRALVNSNIWMPQDSGASLAWLGVSDEAKAVSGKYYEQRRTLDSSEQSYDEKLQEDLWDWTVEFVAQDKQEKERFNKLE